MWKKTPFPGIAANVSSYTALIAVFAFLAAVCFIFSPSASAHEGGFSVFDGLAYPNKPDLGAFGLKKIYIAYTSEIWKGVSSHDEPSEIAVRSLAAKIPRGVPLVLDLEHWNVQGKGKDVDENLNRLIRIVDWVHKENPDIRVGYYGLAPVSNYHKEWNFIRVLNNPAAPQASRYREAYEELRADNARMKKLAAHVDFVCPVLYTFNNLNGATFDACWDKIAGNAIAEAKQYGKPVYAFVWPQFFDLKQKTGDNAFIPDAFWKHELELVRSSGADGLIIWGSLTFKKVGWEESDPWWKITRAFVSEKNR